MSDPQPFDPVTFPTDISFGSSGGPAFETELVELGGGMEVVNARSALPKERWDVVYGVKSEADVDLLMRFFLCRRGKAGGFYFVVPDTRETVRARFDTDYLPSRLEDYKAESATVPIVQLVAE